ncbi:hypothetical protein MAP00_003684 [Monascus purpureus]|nr:hypothetical protein MAP00_003684 [Monascus purpureus]
MFMFFIKSSILMASRVFLQIFCFCSWPRLPSFLVAWSPPSFDTSLTVVINATIIKCLSVQLEIPQNASRAKNKKATKSDTVRQLIVLLDGLQP